MKFLPLIMFSLLIPAYGFTQIKDMNLRDWVDITFSNFKESPSSRSKGDLDSIGFTADIFNDLIGEYQTKFATQNVPVGILGKYAQKLDIPPGSNVVLIGDIQGSYHSLIRNLLRLMMLGYIDNDWKLKDNAYLIFLGDLVGFPGQYQCEVLYTMLRLKLANWERVFCIKGNMDGNPTSYFNGNVKLGKFFQTCPHVLLIKSGDNWVQCCHSAFATGYLSPSYSVPDVLKSSDLSPRTSFKSFMDSEEKYCEIMNYYYFQSGHAFTGQSGCSSYFLTKKEVNDYCANNSIKAIFRGHQDGAFGLKVFFNDTFENNNDVNLQPMTNHITSEKNFSSKSYHGGCGPYRWSTVARAYVNDPTKKITGTQGIFISKCGYPVFTLSTLSEAGDNMNFDCFCILKTAENYDDWALTPYEFYLGQSSRRKDKFVSVKLSGPSQTAGYQDNDPSCALNMAGIDEKIMVTWVDNQAQAGVDIPQLVRSLMSLRSHLEGLKGKLSLLQLQLQELAKKLNQ